MSGNIVPTTVEEMEVLHKADCVNITGLEEYPRYGSPQKRREPFPWVIGLTAKMFSDRGRYGSDSGAYVLVTVGGEVWYRKLTQLDPGPETFAGQRLRESLEALQRRFCPRGEGIYVPGAGARVIRDSDLATARATTEGLLRRARREGALS